MPDADIHVHTTHKHIALSLMCIVALCHVQAANSLLEEYACVRHEAVQRLVHARMAQADAQQQLQDLMEQVKKGQLAVTAQQMMQGCAYVQCYCTLTMSVSCVVTHCNGVNLFLSLRHAHRQMSIAE